MTLLAAALNVGGGLCLAFAFKASKEAPPRFFRWSYGTPIAFNRDLFWLGVAGVVASGLLSAVCR